MPVSPLVALEFLKQSLGLSPLVMGILKRLLESARIDATGGPLGALKLCDEFLYVVEFFAGLFQYFLVLFQSGFTVSEEGIEICRS